MRLLRSTAVVVIGLTIVGLGIGRSLPATMHRGGQQKDRVTEEQTSGNVAVSRAEPGESPNVSVSQAEPRENVKASYDFVVTASTVVMALFTGALVLATVLLWRACEKQIGELKRSSDAAVIAADAAKNSVIFARESAQVDQRAWVLFKGVVLSAQIRLNEPFIVTVAYQNFGRTPGLNVVLYWWILLTKETRVEKFARPEPTGVISVGSAAPGMAFTADTGKLAFGEEDIGLWNAGERLYAYGRIEYDDVFGSHHTSNFCAFTNHGGQLVFATHSEGNEMS